MRQNSEKKTTSQKFADWNPKNKWKSKKVTEHDETKKSDTGKLINVRIEKKLATDQKKSN